MVGGWDSPPPLYPLSPPVYGSGSPPETTRLCHFVVERILDGGGNFLSCSARDESYFDYRLLVL